MFGCYGRTGAATAWRCACRRSLSGRRQQQQQRRLQLFENEQLRQRDAAKGAAQIEVSYLGADGQPARLHSNAGVVTPLDVAAGVSEATARDSALALANGSPWDMRRPLTASCSLRFLPFRPPTSPEEVADLKTCNVALFRSGSLLLGATLETAFKEAYRVQLISFPPPFPKSGSFVYDCQVTKPREEHSILQLSDRVSWQPNRAELTVLGASARRLLAAECPFEPLEVPAALAAQMFEDNDCKLAAVEKIAAVRQTSLVTVYRVGNFVDISSGPMISHAGLIGRFFVASVHQLQSRDFGQLLRVQGVAVPRALAGGLGSEEALVEHASELNFAFLPARGEQAAAAATTRVAQ